MSAPTSEHAAALHAIYEVLRGAAARAREQAAAPEPPADGRAGVEHHLNAGRVKERDPCQKSVLPRIVALNAGCAMPTWTPSSGRHWRST